MSKVFRHHAKMTTARIGDFDRPLTPFVARAAQAIIRAAMQQATEPAAPVGHEAEVLAVMTTFAARIDNARKYLAPTERAAAIRALKLEKAAALRAIRERQAVERHANRIDRQKHRKPPKEPQA